MNYISGSGSLHPSAPPPVWFLLMACGVGAGIGMVSGILAAAVFRRGITGKNVLIHMTLGGLWTFVPPFIPGWDHTIPFGAFLGGVILPVLHVLLFTRGAARHA
jgi:hypothetical protein